jgi:hypothetical protein
MLCSVFRSVRLSLPVSLLSSGGIASRGNWSVDLQAGSDFGYKLLFVVLLAGFFAVILQVIFLVSIPRCCVILMHGSKGLACKLGVVTGLGQWVSFHILFRHPNESPGSFRPCFSLSTSLPQPVKAPQVVSMVHLVPSLCHFRDSHHQYRFGRAPWFCDCPQSTLPQTSSLGRCYSHRVRCPLGSCLCEPTPWPASAVFRIGDRYPGVYILISITSVHISRETGVGRVDMHVYPCLKGSSRVGWGF